MGAGDWYGQMIAVSYERARGIRAMNQKCDGEFSVSVSKVMDVPLPRLFKAATAGGWFPKGGFQETSKTPGQILARQMEEAARSHSLSTPRARTRRRSPWTAASCPTKRAVEKERALWKKAIAKLEASLLQKSMSA